MRALGFTVTEHVGRTGIVAVYRNGAGPTVLVRTELDALPLEEKTGLSYASRAQQQVDGRTSFVDHACGHDSHMAWWIGTAQALVELKDRWHGTLVFVGQPAEEIISGAKAMLADGLFTRFPRPDYGFAAHVGPTPVGTVGVKQGVTSSASDTIKVVFQGVGAHGAMPDRSIDPIVEGAQFVDLVQTVVSRRKDPQKEVRTLLNDGVTRVAESVAALAQAPRPEVSHLFGTSPVVNDDALAAQAAAMLQAAMGAKDVTLVPAYLPGGSASESPA